MEEDKKWGCQKVKVSRAVGHIFTALGQHAVSTAQMGQAVVEAVRQG